jgi:signal transduction histidine kinase
MAALFSFALAFILFLCAYPATTCAQSKPDSLRSIIASMPDTDTVKVDRLLELAHALQSGGRGSESLGVLDQARKLSLMQRYAYGSVRALCQIAYRHAFSGRYRDAHELIHEARQYAARSGNPQAMVEALRFAGIVHITNNKYDSALAALHSAVALASAIPDSNQYYQLLNVIGVVHHDRGEMAEAASYFSRCLAHFERKGDQIAVAQALTNLGNTMSNFAPEEALAYHTRALDLMRPLKDLTGMACNLNAIALLQSSSGDIDGAMRNMQEGIALMKQLGDLRNAFGMSSNLATILRSAGRIEESVALYQSILEMAIRLEFRDAVAQSHINLGFAYQCTGDFAKAWESSMNGYRIAKEIGRTEMLISVTDNLSKIAQDRDDHATALRYYREHIAVRDSVQGKETQQKIHGLREQYEADTREKEIRLLRQDGEIQQLLLAQRQHALDQSSQEALRRAQRIQLLEQEQEISKLELARRGDELALGQAETQRKVDQLAIVAAENALQRSSLEREQLLRVVGIAGTVLLVILAVIGLRRLQEKRKLSETRAMAAEYQARTAEAESLRREAESARREQDIQRVFTGRLITAQEEERFRIARELHDSLSQGLIVVKNRALMGMRHIEDKEKLHAQLQSIAASAGESLEEVRQMSRDLRPHQIEQLGLGEALREMVQGLADASGVEFEVQVDALDGLFHEGEPVAVYRIVQEATNNILKHASAQTASLSAQRENGRLRIEIRDDGRGFDAESALASGFGMQGMTERVRMLGGNMHVESVSGKGSTIIIHLDRHYE